MKQRTARKSVKVLAAAAHLHPLVIDSSRIRKKARQDYEKAKRALARGRQQLEAHQQQDQPAYDRWMNGQFGPLLTQLREINAVLHEKRRLWLEVRSVALMGGLSEAEAYEEVMRRRQTPEAKPASPEDDSPGEQRAADDGCGADAAGEPDPFADFAEFFEKEGRGFNQFFNGPDGCWDAAGRPAPQKSFPRQVKELYRILARKLHPDAQHEMTAQKREWWHQVQAAYAEGDVERLEVILTFCEIEERSSTAATSVSLLGRIAAQLKRALREVKRELFACRRSPAWNFTQRPDHRQLARDIEFEVRADLHAIQSQVNGLEAQFQDWASRSARRKTVRPRVRRADHAGAHFFF